MSVWTHVNVAILFDGIPAVGMKKPRLGEAYLPYCEDEGPRPSCPTVKIPGNCKMPMGSEGSLQYSMVEYGTGLPWIAAHIWGDLRDYASVEDVVAYLNTISQGQMIRSGVGSIGVEGQDERIVRHTDAGWKVSP